MLIHCDQWPLPYDFIPKFEKRKAKKCTEKVQQWKPLSGVTKYGFCVEGREYSLFPVHHSQSRASVSSSIWKRVDRAFFWLCYMLTLQPSQLLSIIWQRWTGWWPIHSKRKLLFKWQEQEHACWHNWGKWHIFNYFSFYRLTKHISYLNI